LTVSRAGGAGTFKTTTKELLALSEWLAAERCAHVAMAATHGDLRVIWRPRSNCQTGFSAPSMSLPLLPVALAKTTIGFLPVSSLASRQCRWKTVQRNTSGGLPSSTGRQSRDAPCSIITRR
jgi:hypothetical protein